MASLPLPALYHATLASPSVRAASSAMVGSAAPQARLSALEWSIVAMAEQDGLASIREPGRFLTALASVFGMTRPNRLGSDRLEALRRVAIFAWSHGWNVPKSELSAFFALGFTNDQYELIQQKIANARSDRRRKTAQ